MTDSAHTAQTAAEVPAATRVQTKIVVPDAQKMVSLLGPRDEILKLVERAVASDVHVRGNEITISGAPADREGRDTDR
jgi:phosphate starvation-inducible PhoH-like protein